MSASDDARSPAATIAIGERRYGFDPSGGVDCSIPLDFGGRQPVFFGATPASSEPLRAGEFIGDTRSGGSCNVFVQRLVPHCNGTHTECIGHVVDDRVVVAEVAELTRGTLVPATLISLDAAPGQPIEAAALAFALSLDGEDTADASGDRARGLREGLVLRTRPNPREKMWADHDAQPPPYLAVEAARLLCEHGVRHLVVDFPSLDPGNDGGALAAHRAYWNLPASSRRSSREARVDCTITELAYVPDELADGSYLLALQIPAFRADAAPSRPLLYRLSVLDGVDAPSWLLASGES